MVKKIIAGLLFVVAVISSIFIFSRVSHDKRGTVRVAAFNVQVFGRSKRSKEEVMDYLAKIAREFDVMLVQELRDATQQTAPAYLEEINSLSGPDYAFVRSERLGRSSSKEAYAYFYNTSTVQHVNDYVWADEDDVFEREPYIASFRSGNFDFTLVGVHIKPSEAEAEIGWLDEVVDEVLARNPDENDVIVLGDLNADGSYLDEDSASPMDGEYFWTITNDMDTTVAPSDNTYDRIVMLDDTLDHEYVPDSSGVFYFDKLYGISDPELVEDISDHYPIYAIFKTDIADDD